MRRFTLLIALVMPVSLLHGGTPVAGASSHGQISFEDRVRAQESIERVYYSHQIDAGRPFDEEVTPDLLERKVRAYLKSSAVLEKAFHRPLTSDDLSNELIRMAHDTRMPERLRELYAALDDDPILVQECLVRPILADRLLREALAHSRGSDRKSPARLAPDSDAGWRNVQAVASLLALPEPRAAATPLAGTCTQDSWDNGTLDHPPVGPLPRNGHGAVWTGSLMLVWGGQTIDQIHTTGDRYDPATDTWTPMSTVDAPFYRTLFSTIWTGNEMIVWGGVEPFILVATNSGGRYDPVSDTWRFTNASSPAPSPRWSPTAVWTGHEMIVWGGDIFAPFHLIGISTTGGGRYDPAADTWASLPSPPGESGGGRAGHSMVWTGDRMLLWGGSCFSFNVPNCGPFNSFLQFPYGSGGSYDPGTNTWTALSSVNGPGPRSGHAAVWGDGVMVIWGGANINQLLQTGGRYDPASDAWSATSQKGAPTAGSGYSVVWAGDQMVIWGGSTTGGRYDPVQDLWGPVTTAGAPPIRSFHTAVWTGQEMIVWGGSSSNTGGRYFPTPLVDSDGDGFPGCGADCDDASSSVYPGAPQLCGDGLNNDCRDTAWPSLAGTNEGDDDGDGFSECQGDCDDSRPNVHPGAVETCDNVDNDCDGIIDEGFDLDADGFTTCSGDCDDTRASVYPGAPQVCDGLNNDCRDTAWPSLAGTNEADDDGDGFSECQGDCDDANAATNPAAIDLPGTTIDENCDGVAVCDPTSPWGPGEYIQCVVQICRELVQSGSVSQEVCTGIIRRSARVQPG